MKISYTRHFLSLVAMVITLVSCVKEPMPGEAMSVKRTVLVYMALNNDLSYEAQTKVDAALSGWKEYYGNLLFLIETPGEAPALKQASVLSGKTTVQTLRTYTGKSSVSGELLAEVLADVKAYCPSSSYGMVFFSHATGWMPEATFNNPYAQITYSTGERQRTVASGGGKEMELSDFADAIPDGMFDFIIFESCFMAGIETTYELKDKTRYILGSSAEVVQPGFTAVYNKNIVRLFYNTPDLEGYAQEFFNYMQNIDQYKSATVSLIKTEEVENLAAIIKDVKAVEKSFEIAGIQYFDRKSNDHLFFDLRDYVSAQANAEQLVAFDNALKKCVIYKAATPGFLTGYRGFNIISHSGLTTYIEQDVFPFLNFKYKSLKWHNAVSV